MTLVQFFPVRDEEHFWRLRGGSVFTASFDSSNAKCEMSILKDTNKQRAMIYFDYINDSNHPNITAFYPDCTHVNEITAGEVKFVNILNIPSRVYRKNSREYDKAFIVRRTAQGRFR